MQYKITFSTGEVNYLFQQAAETIGDLYPPDRSIIVTDSNVAELYGEEFSEYPIITLPAGEDNKNSYTATGIVDKLLDLEAHRKTTLIGLGGGMITDITGYVASIYMRGLNCAYIPTTLLGMVDAAIVGKTGINFGKQKNLLGTIRQPASILFDISFLQTLPDEEWSNGFAEVIKYACLFDTGLFEELEQHNIKHYQNNQEALSKLISRCVEWKNRIVKSDEQESDVRKLLNLGHTAGHALETQYHLPHGYAVSLGMIIACMVSEKTNGLKRQAKERLIKMLRQYHLPVRLSFDVKNVMEVLIMDKKRNKNSIDYILLDDIGQGIIKELPFNIIEDTLTDFLHEGGH